MRRCKPKFSKEACRSGGEWSPRRDWDLHEIIAAFYDARKGYVFAEGVNYSADGISTWCLRHSTRHAKQFDVVHNGQVIARGNARSLPCKWIRSKARRAAMEHVTYGAIGADMVA